MIFQINIVFSLCLFRNHPCRNGSQLIKTACVEAFFLVSSIRDFVLRAAEEQLQVYIGRTGQFMQEAVSLKLTCSQMNQQRNVRVTLKEYSHGHIRPMKADICIVLYCIVFWCGFFSVPNSRCRMANDT